MVQDSQDYTHIIGPTRAVILTLTLLVTTIMLGIFLRGVPARFEQLATLVSPDDAVLVPGLTPMEEAGPLSRLGPEDKAALASLGVSMSAYAAYILFWDLAVVLVGLIIALVIFLRKSDSWMAIWIAYVVVLLGTNGVSFVVPSLSQQQSGWMLVSLLFGTTGMASHVLLFFLAPDGRFIPRWTWLLGLGFAGAILGAGIVAVRALPDILIGMIILLLLFPIWFILLGVGIVAQIYRYLRISNPAQRQQTKWVAFGLGMTMVGISLNVIMLNTSYQVAGSQRLILNLVRAPLVNLCLMFLALSLAFSIFRYKLWDIDLIIRRTTSYAALTALLAGIYFGVVVLLQGFLGAVGLEQNELSIVLSTLAIAALVRPLQARIQNFIDRRFYRARYDSERALARFSDAARDEVDVDRLADSMLDVVEVTMQPEQASLWVRK